jgi:hypothetical protein
MQGNMPDFPTLSTLSREANKSERTQAYFPNFSFSVNKRLSGKRKTVHNTFFPEAPENQS